MLQVVHKGVTFTQSEKLPSRLLFAGSYFDVPSQAITDLNSNRGGILITCGREIFQLIFSGPGEWSLIDKTPQSAVYQQNR